MRQSRCRIVVCPRRGVVPGLAGSNDQFAQKLYTLAIMPGEHAVSANEFHVSGLTVLRATINNLIAPAPSWSSPRCHRRRRRTPLLEISINPSSPDTEKQEMGGLETTKCQLLAHALIARSCGAPADLIRQNINVFHEALQVEGMDGPVFVLIARDDAMPPPDLADLSRDTSEAGRRRARADPARRLS